MDAEIFALGQKAGEKNAIDKLRRAMLVKFEQDASALRKDLVLMRALMRPG